VGRISADELPVALAATANLTSVNHAKVETISVYRIEPGGARPVFLELPLQ